MIPTGSDVYIGLFDGLTLPTGEIHNGWFQAVDTSHSFGGFQIDIFAATYPDYMEINALLNASVMDIVAPINSVESKTILATAGAKGTIWPEGSVRVAVGKGEKFFFFPAANYAVDQVLVNGSSVAFNSVENSCMVDNVTTDSTISVSFKEVGPVDMFTITSSVTNGEITASKSIDKGSDATFTFNPSISTYKLDKVLIDGVETQVSGNSYTFVNVVADSTIEVIYSDVIISPELVADYTIGTDWGSGFGANVVITNNSLVEVDSWGVTLTYSGNQTITGWNGVFSQAQNVVSITNTGWNGTIAPGGTVSFGMNGSYSGSNEIPIITVE